MTPAQPHSVRLVPRHHDTPREALRRAHAARASLLADTRREATRALAQELVDTARTLLKEAAAHRDELFQAALASSAARPPELIEAEQRVVHLTNELAFAQEKMRQSDNEMAIAKSEAEATTTLIRDTSRSVIADEMARWATHLKARLDAIDTERACLRGAIAFAAGQAIMLSPVVHATDERPQLDFSRNTPAELTTRSAAASWREAFDAMQIDATAPLPMPEEEE